MGKKRVKGTSYFGALKKEILSGITAATIGLSSIGSHAESKRFDVAYGSFKNAGSALKLKDKLKKTFPSRTNHFKVLKAKNLFTVINDINKFRKTANFVAGQHAKKLKDKPYAIGDLKSAKEVKGKLKVVLDPGHGGHDPGAVCDEYRESELNFKMADTIRDYLEKKGVDVILTRPKDKSRDLGDRVRIANDKGADYFISLHVDSIRSKKAIGTDVYIHTRADKNSQNLADKVMDNLDKAEIRRANFFVLRKAKIPAVLIEAGNIQNEDEVKKIKSKNYQTSLAEAIYAAIK